MNNKFVELTKGIKLFKELPKIGDIETIGNTEYVLVKYVSFKMLKSSYLKIKCLYQLATLKPKFLVKPQQTITVYAQHKYTKFVDDWWDYEVGGLMTIDGEFYQVEELTMIELRGTDIYLEYEVSELQPFETGATRKELLEHRKKKIGLVVL
ncbi:hypothetical protein [Kurthia huakuii]|uniref:hypothetical protein n=1 Tax=Kurthia huakuii TaxID=1421019 RepID=UPI0004953895|nr:hypothetical protein [Kurthia huakuii]MBM7698664.1 hypothetical protein [Kurthia huakuii]